MKFGFHEYHRSFRDRFSLHKRIYVLLMLMFSLSIASTSISMAQPHLLSFAQDNTLKPIPENYSAPLTAKIETPRKSKKVVGFLPSWNVAVESKVYPEYLDQIIYFGIPMDKTGALVKVDSEKRPIADWTYLSSPYFQSIRTKSKETNTKILVTIKNFDNESIYSIITNPTNTKRAVTELNALIADYDLDGIDINFEYYSGDEPPTLQYLNKFLSILKTELKKKKPDLLLSFDVNATVIYNDNAYDMVKIGEEMDQVIIMGYDYTRPQSGHAGPIAPLYESGDKASVSRSLQSVMGRVPKEKIILGMPLYGYEWQTYTKDYESTTVPDTGATATYRRIRDLIANRKDVKIAYDDITKSPWLVYTQNGLTKQIHYEDEKSMKEKIDLVYEKDIAGIGLWALGYEGDYVEPWQLITEQIGHKK